VVLRGDVLSKNDFERSEVNRIILFKVATVAILITLTLAVAFVAAHRRRRRTQQHQSFERRKNLKSNDLSTTLSDDGVY
jgi:hypothetical protein